MTRRERNVLEVCLVFCGEHGYSNQYARRMARAILKLLPETEPRP